MMIFICSLENFVQENAKSFGFNIYDNYKCSNSLDEIFEFIEYWEKNMEDIVKPEKVVPRKDYNIIFIILSIND